MKLTFDQIAAATCGAVYLDETDAGICFHRFTKEQEALYRSEHPQFLAKTVAAAGVRMAFQTDSESLTLKAVLSAATSRSFYAFEIRVNGSLLGCVDNVPGSDARNPSHCRAYPLGEMEKTVALGKGEKTVEIFLPWSVKTELAAFSLDDGATFAPLPKKAKRLMTFGDSITQGNDAVCPSNAYAVRLADAFGMELFDKGIGGEKFFPALAACRDAFVPDLITVAYGTNDWNSCPTRKELEENCTAFFGTLRESYPDTRIFAITPIWRKDRDTEGKCCPFDEVKAIITEAVSPLSRVTLIEGDGLVPHEPRFFLDGYLHPNDEGFRCYSDNLIAKIKETL